MTLYNKKNILDKYEIKEKIAKDGMGIVYSAWDQKLEREVAIKRLVISDNLSEVERQGLIDRFREEAKITAKLDHLIVFLE